ncbi:hypothetical protein WN944_000546 [Citrus x changshan-huyou]|uniref:Uncharacterized protein n=1 Tax=Citrus x changshan-huyou TaxID=2935761 RepID=A0AAP0MD39_9ROSI
MDGPDATDLPTKVDVHQASQPYVSIDERKIHAVRAVNCGSMKCRGMRG